MGVFDPGPWCKIRHGALTEVKDTGKHTLPTTSSSPLKIGGWETILLGYGLFSVYVCFRDGKQFLKCFPYDPWEAFEITGEEGDTCR